MTDVAAPPKIDHSRFRPVYIGKKGGEPDFWAHEDAPQSEIQATIDKIVSGEIKRPPVDPNTDKGPTDLPGMISGAGKAIATGGLEGVLGSTFALPKNLMDLANVGVSKALGVTPTPIPKLPNVPGTNVSFSPSSEDFTNALKRQGLYHEAQGPVEKFLQAGAAGAGSMVNPLNPLKYSPALGVLGVSSGLTGELADRMAGGDSPFMRAMGNVLGMAPGYLTLKTPQLVKSVRDMLSDTGSSGIESAVAGQANASKTLGVPTVLAHQLPPTDPLGALAMEVARDPKAGAPMRKMMAGEQAAMEQKAKDFAAGLSPSDLGSVGENTVQRAGIAAVHTAPADARRAITGPLYDVAKANDYIPDTRGIIDSITKLQAERGAQGGQAGAVVTRVKKELSNLDTLFPNGIPTQEVDNLRKGYQGSSNIQGLKPKALQGARGYGLAADAIGDYLDQNAPNLAVAKKAFSDISTNLNDPVLESALGKVFPDAKATTGNYTQQQGLFNPDRFNTSDVADAAQRMGKVDPTAFPILMKQTVTSALENSGGDMPAFVNNFVGKDRFGRQRANMLEGINQTALAHGMSPEDAAAAAAGADNLLTVLDTVGTGQKRLGPIDTTGAMEAAGTSGPTSFMRSVFSLGRNLPEAIDAAVRGNTMSKIADVFTSPDGLTKLKDIANYSPLENSMEILSKALGSTVGQTEGAAPPTE